MGSLFPKPAQPGPAPKSPDAADMEMLARRRERAFSLFSLGKGFSGNFGSPTSMGTKPEGGPVSYGMPEPLIGQYGDENGTDAAPDLRDKTLNLATGKPNNAKPLDPNDPNKGNSTVPKTGLFGWRW